MIYLISTIAICIISFMYIKNKQLYVKYNNLSKEHQEAKEDIKEYYETLFKAWCIEHEREIRKDSLKRSRSIIRGQATEHLAPFMMKDVNPKDCRFIGNPIDYIIFKGGSNLLDRKANEIEKIIFVDIKTGQSNLTKIQRRIRQCIAEGRVEFLLYNPDKQNEQTNNVA